MNIKKGGEVIYNPPFTLPITHPLRFLPTRLTDRDEFKVEVGLLLKQEANVGIRLMFEPEHERDFDWDNDDIFVGVHLRWHFAYGPSREISVHEKYNGQFQPGETITPEAHWPDLKVGEKFLVIIVKGKECFEVYTVLGKDIYAQFYIEKPYMHRFCPLPRRENRMLSDPKKLRVVVNEDNPYSGDVQVDSITWFPTNR
ncbi:hypothetical protein SK128_007974 [Halocaridina rubra]|uniref:Galectin domain-containing protein n=1 Tax=Halocaridina rubra TaxID=373956 RepID=A0AAN8WQV0_HALRR